MTTAQITAVLLALEERLTDPEGQLQYAYRDLLRTYGLVAQLAEVATEQREQIQAMADILSMLLGRVIEHNRATIAHGVAVQSMYLTLEAIARAQGADIAQEAADARDLLHEAAAAQLAELEQHAEAARLLLRTARMDARAIVKHAVGQAQDEIAAAASDARDVLREEANE